MRSFGLRCQYASRLSLSEGSCLAATKKCRYQLSISLEGASSSRKQRVKPASVCALVKFARQASQGVGGSLWPGRPERVNTSVEERVRDLLVKFCCKGCTG